ncbi:MAG: Ig-like domain-containing protein [Xanthomonadales bacterium]|jgi:hypothetical protein|nr:Ig-like domain-containing protein [Xanthomonadales bacterium]
MKMSRPRTALATAAITLSLILPVAASANDNDDLTIRIAALIGTHNAALPISFIPDPFLNISASAVTFGTNLGLKNTRAVFLTPDDWESDPNSPDQCTYDFDLPQSAASYSNLLGFITLEEAPEAWGALTTEANRALEVVHANTDVDVSVENPFIEPDRLAEECSIPLVSCQAQPPQRVKLPSGRHTMAWKAETQISDAFDIIIPAALLGFNIGYYGASWANQGASATRQLFVQNQARQRVVDWAVKAGAFADSTFDILGTRTTVTHEREQEVTIWKRVPPEVNVTQPNITLEATDFGGVLYQRVAKDLRATVEAGDPCGKAFSLGNDAGPLLPIGTTVLRWTVRDTGPLPGGGFNSDFDLQQITVQDTQGPILVPPPSRVIEIPSASSGLDASQVNLGAARVVDLADPDPAIDNDGPGFYDINQRTPITWTATDASGNSTSGDQLITIKAAGSNTEPTVSDVATSTLTSEPVDVVLSGSDPDFLPGTGSVPGSFDPLHFRITDRPDNGEFVAPLYPFFIEDYRTSPGGPYGEAFYLANPRSGWLDDNVCRVLSGPNKDKIRVDWVYEPEFVHVDDDGKAYILDRFWECSSGGPTSKPRISTWDRDGNFIGQIEYQGDNDAFVVDRDGFIVEFVRIGSGSSREIFVDRCDSSFTGKTSRASVCESLGSVDSGVAPGLQDSTVSYARVDSGEGLLYVTDKRRVFVFDIRNDPPNPRYLATLNDETPFPTPSPSCAGSSLLGYAMDIDSRGNLYMVNCANERIEKFTRSYFDEEGVFVPGEYVGWLGSCTGSTNNACDEDRLASKGFSCTDSTCQRGQLPGEWAGDQPGQFATPLYIAIDPNDVLYVAEWDNFRIQRFSPDGTFAGQAISTGSGINQGEQPGFILGNMGRPRAVSVNSNQFYVVDREEGFAHVFETSPLKDITDNSATVTYVSDFDFHSATDSFQFVASDGLADSAPGTVTIDVARNFRAPVTEDLKAATEERVPVNITLTAEDPDGIVGVDFNGLDRLAFRVVQPPAHGTLVPFQGDNESLTLRYEPDDGFFGEDTFRYVANDGVDDSNESTVVIDVAYVDDPPVITAVELPERAGLGFPVMLRGVFTDDGASNPDNYFTSVVWTSDGQSSTIVEGGINEDDPDNPKIEGVYLIRPTDGLGTGYGIAQRTFTTPGTKTGRFCILDSAAGSTPCENRVFTVEPLVNLGLDLPDDLQSTSLPAVPFGESFTIDLVINNQLPEGVPGLEAEAVALQGIISTPGVIFTGSSAGDCTISPNGKTIDCAFGDLAPGEQLPVSLTVTATSGDPDEFPIDIALSVTTASEAVNETTEAFLIRDMGGTRIFRSGFE